MLAERRRTAAAAEKAAAPAVAAKGGEESESTSSFSGPSDDGEEEEDEEEEAGGTDESGEESSASAGGELDDDPPAGAPGSAVEVRAKDRVVGAASFEMVEEAQCPRDTKRVLQLTLIGVRTKFQSLGLGSQLLRRALSPRLAGRYDTTIAFADHDAVRFFRKYGFSDDPILTSRFRKVVDAWDQSVLMVRQVVTAPPRGVAGGGADDQLLHPPSSLAEPSYLAGADLRASIDEWRESKVEGYSRELSLMEAMHAELCMLRQRVVRQDDYARFLKAEVVQLHGHKARLTEQLAHLNAQLDTLTAQLAAAQGGPPQQAARTSAGGEPGSGAAPRGLRAAGGARSNGGQEGQEGDEEGDEGPGRCNLSSLLAPLDARSDEHARLAAAFAASLRPHDHSCGELRVVRVWQLASAEARAAREREFAAAVRRADRLQADGTAGAQAAVPTLELYLGAPAEVQQHVRASRVAQLAAPACCREPWPTRALALYPLVCCPRPLPTQVLVNGFDMELWPPRNEALRHLEVFGDGMYLTRYASKAHHFSAGCQFVLVVAAHLTDSHIVVMPDKTRSLPDGASTAIVVPGRQLPGRTAGILNAQAKPSVRDTFAMHASGEEFVVFKERLPPLMPLCMIEYAVDEDTLNSCG